MIIRYPAGKYPQGKAFFAVPSGHLPAGYHFFSSKMEKLRIFVFLRRN